MNQEEIVLSGELTISSVTEIRARLLAGIGLHASTVLRLREAADIDLAFLQLLCSAHRTAVSAGKRLRLDAESSPLLLQQLAAAGFGRHTGCRRDCGNSCLWVAAGNAEGQAATSN